MGPAREGGRHGAAKRVEFCGYSGGVKMTTGGSSGHRQGRRTVLKAMGLMPLLTTAGLHLPGAVRAADQSLAGSACLSVLYRNIPGERFDAVYYRDRHMPLILERFAAAIERFEFMRLTPGGQSGTAEWVAAASLWIRDAERFAAASHRHGAELTADLANVTAVELVPEAETIIAEFGQPLDSSRQGQLCRRILFPALEGASFDEAYYVESFLPRMLDAYGSEAITRIEARRGAVNGRLLASAVVYIGDSLLYDQARVQHASMLNAGIPAFSNVLPRELAMEIAAVG